MGTTIFGSPGQCKRADPTWRRPGLRTYKPQLTNASGWHGAATMQQLLHRPTSGCGSGGSAAATARRQHGDAARSWRAAVCELPQSRSVLLQPLLGTSPSSVGPPSPEARPRHVDMQTLAACSRTDLGRPLVGARRPPQPGHGGQSGFSWPCTASRRVRRAGCNLHVAAQAARGPAPPAKPPAAAATAAAVGLAVTSSWPCKGGSLVSCLLWMDGREVPGCTKVGLK